MEIRSINSITEFAFFKIKRSLFHFILTVIGLALLYFFILESIYHLEWIRNGLLEIENKNFASAFFYTFIVVCIAASIGLLSLDIYLIIIMIREYKKIKYYREPRFSIIEKREFEYDYKLWQTAPKNTFHSQAIKMKIKNEERIFKSPIIFTNSKRIGFFKVPKILQSHSYVRGKCEIGYDPLKDEAIILSTLE